MRAVLAAVLAAVFAVGGVHAVPLDPVDVRFGRHPGFWRIALEWAEPTPAEVTTTTGEVVVAPFRGKAATAERVARRLEAVVRHAVVADDALRLVLRPGVEAAAVPGLDPRILAVDFRPAPTPAVAPAPAVGTVIVPRRRPPPHPATARAAPEPYAPVAPFPVEAEPPAASPAAATTEPGVDAAAEPGGTLPPLPKVSAPTVPRPGSAGGPGAAVPVPPAPEANAASASPPPTPSNAVTAAPDAADPTVALTGPLPRPVPSPAAPTPGGQAAVGADREGEGDDARRGTPTAPADAAEGAVPDAAVAAGEASPPRLTITAQGEALSFRFPAPVDAAAWRRGEHVWLVFAAAPDALVVSPPPAAGVERIPHASALVWRVTVASDAPHRLEAVDATWLLRPGRPPDGAGEEMIEVDADDAVAVLDPWLNEHWHVLPAGPRTGGTATTERDGPRLWLPTLQGRRFRDLSAAGAPTDASRAGLRAPLPRPELGAVIGLAGPTPPAEVARERRRALETSLFADPTPARRIALARFLLGQARPFDALAVLGAASPPADDTDAAVRLRALEAVATVLTGRLERAEQLMPPVDTDAGHERWLWHGMLAAGREDWARAGEAFARSGQVWRRYPLPLKRRVARRAAEAALALDAPQVAQTVLHQVDGEAVAPAIAGELTLLEARALTALGDVAAAREKLLRLERDDVAPEIRHRARLARVRLDHTAGELDDAAARDILEADAVAWTGRADAAAFWRFLGDRRAATGDAPGAFEAWRRGGVEPFGEPQRALIDALVDGEPPFDDALADAVVVLERHLDALAEGPARAERLRRLAARVAAETDALHVADRLYRRALAEPLPHALVVDLRLALAELRLQRQLPKAALEALAPLDGAVDGRIAAVVAEARTALEGRDPAIAEPPAPPGVSADADGLDAALEAVEATLAETRRLLEAEAPADDDGL